MSRSQISRRHVLWMGGGAALLAALPGYGQSIPQPVFSDYPFQLGIASGEPSSDGFVIWTRLAPRPLEQGHGMPAAVVPVQWQVAEDEGFRTVVQTGDALARPELGHSVHVEVAGLQPGRPYFYRFTAGRERSMMGRARTLPAPGTDVQSVRFAVGGCQHYEQGLYTAWRHAAAEDLDFVFCYGDYIYEGRSQRMRSVSGWPVVSVRQHPGQEIYSLEDYRQRYAIYKMDPDLQGAHAAAAWFPVWDDHEIDNNWVADFDQDGTPPEVFRLRKQAAMQAFYENMPLRSTSFPSGPSMSLYRRASFGNLLDMNFLDTRQYRTDQPCGDRWRVECADLNNPEADVLGAAQEAWLMKGLSSSRARWKALAQQVMMMDLDREPGETYAANLDTWGGYRAPRERFLRALTDRRIKDTAILTGDEHQNYAGNVHLDGQNPGKTPITSEFVATSISSGGDGADMRPDMPEVVAVNPELKFNNAQRGYLLCEVTPDLWKTHFRVVDQISAPGGNVSTRATFALEHGKPGLVEA